MLRGSHLEVFCKKKDVLKSFTEVTVKHLFWSLFFLNASQIFLKYYRVSQFLKIGYHE